jgi:hypothetical protein
MRERIDLEGNGSLRQLVALPVVAFVVALGVMLGSRMSSDAIAVLVGVVAGVAASIPTALLLMAVTRRGDAKRSERYDGARQGTPPVIVVAPGQMPQGQLPYPVSYRYEAPRQEQGRQFRVMGWEDDQDDVVEAEEASRTWHH